MSDFEVHPIGTTRELALSRKLARAIAEAINSQESQESGVFPSDVMAAYTQLIKEYDRQMETQPLIFN